MIRFIVAICTVVAFSCASIPKPSKIQMQCAAVCANIDALDCWNTSDIISVISAASQFVTCERACDMIPDFSLDFDPMCFIDRPDTCEKIAKCIKLTTGK